MAHPSAESAQVLAIEEAKQAIPREECRPSAGGRPATSNPDPSIPSLHPRSCGTDENQALRSHAIHITGADVPLDMVLHTPGALVLAVLQIASAVSEQKANVMFSSLNMGMSGGTLIPLTPNRAGELDRRPSRSLPPPGQEMPLSHSFPNRRSRTTGLGTLAGGFFGLYAPSSYHIPRRSR
jgi:hypothetical protein